jgi:hypothetical protein
MQVPRLQVHQHLTIAGVETRQCAVRVEVQVLDGTTHWISFRFDDEHAARSHAATMERWRDDATPLSYVRGAGQGALVDDSELFRLAFEAVE